MNFRSTLENREIKASVPCRIDFGGTLDISTFFLPLGHLNPATFNIALDMRTKVTLSPWKDGYIKISSKGFESAEFEADKAPFNHQMGLMFAVVRFFNGHGVHVKIESSSPPRSALGGSSAAAVAMIAAFKAALKEEINPEYIALLAHYIESSVAGVPCGLQDQLAAAYGGVNLWYWKMGSRGVEFLKESIISSDKKDKNSICKNNHNNNIQSSNNHNNNTQSSNNITETISNKNKRLLDNAPLNNDNILIAYCGIPHVSSDINKRWVNSFISGENRPKWEEIVKITHSFSDAVKKQDFDMAASLMNKETQLRLEMTPDVLDKTGKELFYSAQQQECGARFTGAGGGGCLWAVGDKSNIKILRNAWKEIVEKESQAQLLDAAVDFQGIIIE